jgi:hypothetical protein
MGNSSSTPINIDISAATLHRTSEADKEWLGVSEEQLFDDLFTNEMYYRLNPREKINHHRHYHHSTTSSATTPSTSGSGITSLSATMPTSKLSTSDAQYGVLDSYGIEAASGSTTTIIGGSNTTTGGGGGGSGSGSAINNFYHHTQSYSGDSIGSDDPDGGYSSGGGVGNRRSFNRQIPRRISSSGSNIVLPEELFPMKLAAGRTRSSSLVHADDISLASGPAVAEPAEISATEERLRADILTDIPALDLYVSTVSNLADSLAKVQTIT